MTYYRTMKRNILLVLAMTLTACSTGFTMVSEPGLGRPTKCAEKSWYDARVEAYASHEGMSQEWTDSLKLEYEHNCLAQALSEYYHDRGTPIVFSVKYRNGVEWEGNEDVHMALLKDLLELEFPFTFELNLDGDPAESDAVISLNDPGNSWANGEFIAISPGKEGILIHEVGHFFGLHHHYDTVAEMGHHGHMAPPGDERCVQDRSSQEHDTVCRFALGADAHSSHAEEIASLVDAVNGK